MIKVIRSAKKKLRSGIAGSFFAVFLLVACGHHDRISGGKVPDMLNGKFSQIDQRDFDAEFDERPKGNCRDCLSLKQAKQLFKGLDLIVDDTEVVYSCASVQKAMGDYYALTFKVYNDEEAGGNIREWINYDKKMKIIDALTLAQSAGDGGYAHDIKSKMLNDSVIQVIEVESNEDLDHDDRYIESSHDSTVLKYLLKRNGKFKQIYNKNYHSGKKEVNPDWKPEADSSDVE